MVGGYAETERTLPKIERDEVWRRFNGKCAECGAAGEEIDHIKDSSSDPRNLQLLCRRCHRLKTESSMVPAADDLIVRVRQPILGRLTMEPPLQPSDSKEWDYRYWATSVIPTAKRSREVLEFLLSDGIDQPNREGTVFEAARGIPQELKAWSWYDEASRIRDISDARDNEAALSKMSQAQKLWDRGGDSNTVGSLFRDAMLIDPKCARHIANLARFVACSICDLDQAERLYLEALDVDPGCSFAINDYSRFPEIQRADFRQATVILQSLPWRKRRKIDLPEGMKICTRCLKVLTVADFGKHRGMKDGLSSMCRNCKRESAKAWRQDNPGRG